VSKEASLEKKWRQGISAKALAEVGNSILGDPLILLSPLRPSGIRSWLSISLAQKALNLMCLIGQSASFVAENEISALF
jgi:hypothetical protein